MVVTAGSREKGPTHTWWVEFRVLPNILQCSGQHPWPPTKNHPAPTVSSAEAGKPCLGGFK